jgi:hypothetical protein
MIIYVHEGGSDRVELTEVLIKEGVTYQECKVESVRELGTASYRLVEIQANLPEVIPCLRNIPREMWRPGPGVCLRAS